VPSLCPLPPIGAQKASAIAGDRENPGRGLRNRKSQVRILPGAPIRILGHRARDPERFCGWVFDGSRFAGVCCLLEELRVASLHLVRAEVLDLVAEYPFVPERISHRSRAFAVELVTRLSHEGCARGESALNERIGIIPRHRRRRSARNRSRRFGAGLW